MKKAIIIAMVGILAIKSTILPVDMLEDQEISESIRTSVYQPPLKDRSLKSRQKTFQEEIVDGIIPETIEDCKLSIDRFYKETNYWKKEYLENQKSLDHSDDFIKQWYNRRYNQEINRSEGLEKTYSNAADELEKILLSSQEIDSLSDDSKWVLRGIVDDRERNFKNRHKIEIEQFEELAKDNPDFQALDKAIDGRLRSERYNN